MSSSASPPVRHGSPTYDTPNPPDNKDPFADYGNFTPSLHCLGTSDIYTPFSQSQSASLLSPPMTPSEPLVKQDGGCFTVQSTLSPSQHTQVLSPSDNSSGLLCLRPGVSSTGSAHSCHTCHSHSSIDHLSPPPLQSDCDNPSYRPRRGSFSGLTLISQPQRAQTIPHDKRRSSRREHKISSNSRRRWFMMYEHQARSYWWFPGCQIGPTAASGQKELLESRTGKSGPKKTRRGNIGTYDLLRPRITSGSMYSGIKRRWSSFEVGAHRVLLEPILQFRAGSDESMKPVLRGESSNPINHDQRYRSSKFSRTDIEHNIIQTVRERLTLRKVGPTPASITLRRASRASTDTDVSAPSSNGDGQDLYQEQFSTAYLITAKDIDSIAELIEASLKRKFEDQGEVSRTATNAKPQNGQNVISQSPKTSGTDGPKSFASESVVLASEPSSPQLTLDYLRVNPTYKYRKNIFRRSGSEKYVHGILWDGKSSPPSGSSLTEDDDGDSMRLPSCVCLELITPSKSLERHTCRPINMDQESQLKDNSFNPEDVRCSINEWSWSYSQNEIAMVITSSEDEGNKQGTEDREDEQKEHEGINEDSVPRTRLSCLPKDGPRSPRTRTGSPSRERVKVRPFSRYADPSKQLREVESFPALPRKTTNDWFSPLPEINSPVPMTSFQPLYDIGLDINCGPSVSRVLTTRTAQSSEMLSAQVSSEGSVQFNFDHDYSTRFNVRTTEVLQKNMEVQSNNARSNVITKSHPKAPARTGSPSTLGSSIGISTGERKRSSKTPPPPPAKSSSDHSPTSMPDLKRVRTIDNMLKKERSNPCLKWRKPSVCPPRQTPSPSEYEDAREEKSLSPDLVPVSPRPNYSLAHRSSLIQTFSPPIAKLDHVGIYGKLTGAKRKPMTGEPCVQKEEMDGDAHRCEICTNSFRKTPSAD